MFLCADVEEFWGAQLEAGMKTGQPGAAKVGRYNSKRNGFDGFCGLFLPREPQLTHPWTVPAGKKKNGAYAQSDRARFSSRILHGFGRGEFTTPDAHPTSIAIRGGIYLFRRAYVITGHVSHISSSPLFVAWQTGSWMR